MTERERRAIRRLTGQRIGQIPPKGGGSRGGGWQNLGATPKYGPNPIASLARFGLLALIPVIALGAVLAHELNVDVQQRYLETARSSAILITQVGIQPLLTAEQVAAGGMNPTQVTQMDRKLEGAAVSRELRRLKVWNRNGTIVYSDNHSLIGKTFPIDDDLDEALAGESSASITDGHSAENVGDDLNGPLIEVYVPLVFNGSSTPSGAFELYLPYAPVQAAIDRESNQLYLFLAIGLALFYASMFPVVVIADRWRRRLLREAENTAMANLAVLERLNKLKSEFLTRISHQFRTALVGIQGFSEVIKESDELGLEEVKAFASDIYNDAERLDRAFGQMVELDRMEAGGAILKFARVDVNELIASSVDATRRQSPKHSIKARLDPSIRGVTCDRERVAQVLEILLDNAVRYSPAGSEVALTSKAENESVTVSVADHGPGMPADFDDGLFVGYKREATGAGNGFNRSASTGLELPIARQIVEMHGGRIYFETTTGQGTAFHFSLPLALRPSRQLRAVARDAAEKATAGPVRA